MRPLEREFAESTNLSVLSAVTTVVAVSGGPDSVALLRLLASQLPSLREGSTLVVAHFNHGWREAAREDERFVRQLASSLGLQFHLGHVDSDTRQSEAVGRKLRYDFLKQVAHQCGARYLLTGHTADDQAETVLFHVLRGSGLRGIRGIPEVRQLDKSLTLKRPLLRFTRAQLSDYLDDLGQPSCCDMTNEDIRFTRNRIRHELMPFIESVMQRNPRTALCRLGQITREAFEELQPAVDRASARAVTSRTPQVVTLDCRKLASVSPFIVREVLAQLWQTMCWSVGELTYAKWCQLEEMIRGPAGVIMDFPGSVRATRTSNSLQLERMETRAE